MGQRNGLSAGPDVKLPEEVPEVKLHSIFADAKVSGNRAITLAGSQQLKDLKFPAGQPPFCYVPSGSRRRIQRQHHGDIAPQPCMTSTFMVPSTACTR